MRARREPEEGRRRRRLPRRLRRGFGLLQVVLAIAVGAIAVASGLGLYNMAVEGANKSATLALLSTLRAAVDGIYANRATYGTAGENLVPVLAQRGGIPDSALIPNAAGAADDTIQHPYGDAVTVVVAPNNTRFRITLEDLLPEVCASIADSYAGRTRARSGLVNMVFGTTPQAAPVTVAQINTGCTGTEVDLGFTFG